MATRMAKHKKFAVAYEREDDGRWIAEIPQIAGALAYGKTKPEARARARARATAIALRAIADKIEQRKTVAAVDALFV